MTYIKNENLKWYEKYHTLLMIGLGILFLLAFIFFVKYFFKTEPQNQVGQILIDKQGQEIKIEKVDKYESNNRSLEIKTTKDGLVYGTYTVDGLMGTFEGRYSDDKKMLYTTMEYMKNGKLVVEEMIFKFNSDGAIGVGIGKKHLGKNGIDIYEDIEKTDFNSVVLEKKQ